MTIEDLREAVQSTAVAIRGRAILQPAGGPGDKVFPPTYSVSDRNPAPGARYAREKRRLAGGEVVDCVLLDSVQSQANRMEEALQALWAAKRITLPVITVNFADVAPEVGVVTSLTAPHRIADAILRDSLCDGELFRFSPLGRSFAEASIRNAAPLFRVCPTALVFGMWDSTGPRGGLGAKFARALVSEIVGIAAELGVKTSSRIDPVGIMKDAGPVFVANDPDPDGNPTWTHDALQAKPIDPDKPPKNSDDAERVEKWGKKEKAGKPSSINHSNQPPDIDGVAGGVTIGRAEQTIVLSLAGLRRLSFGGDAEDVAARTTLAALGLLAVLAAEDRGLDLRSRCFLVPEDGGALKLEKVAKDGKATPLALDLEGAIEIYQAAVAALPPSLRFRRGDSPLGPGETLAELVPTAKLVHLVRKSRELAAAGAEIEGE